MSALDEGSRRNGDAPLARVTEDVRVGAQHEVIWFQAGDGRRLNFHRHRPATGTRYRGPLLLVAGTSVRANIFSPPEPITLPQVLTDAG